MTDQQTVSHPTQIVKANGWLTWLSLCFGLIALSLSLGVAIYFYYHASAWQASFSASAREQSDLQRTLKHNKRDINSLNDTVETLGSHDKTTAQTLTQLQTQITALQTQWSKPALAHSLYLVQLAQDALLYQFDGIKASLYLQEAHNELTQSNDAELQALDASLQQTLATLQAMPPLNIPKIISQLSGLQDTVNALPLTQTEPKNMAKTKGKSGSFWNHLWGSAWQGLQKVITIKHYGSDAPHFITPDERAYLNARLCLYLNQAQWAALAHNTALFNSSIIEAERWLRAHYDTNNATAQDLLQKLKPLETINLQPNFPNLSPVIARMQQTLLNNGK
ncbi:MAG: uroporphyrinogen-III C-methyltransferase [Gammaproteobacteria bacterium]|nr:uroporphyrinogen-III C-methyltransferase [Gammaproteobacteria bacterium]